MATAALADLRIIEWGEGISAPYCAKLLADLGAEVIKVEVLPSGDPARRMAPRLPGAAHLDGSALFLYLNTNKHGVALDVETATGREILHRLLDQADIFVENHAPATMDRLGLDYPSLRARHPALIVVSIAPFGQTGPYRDYRTSDLVSVQMGGYGFLVPGPVEDPVTQPPLRLGGRQTHYLAGAHGAIAALQAWFLREQTGEGRQADVSEHEAAASLMSLYLQDSTFGDTPPQRQKTAGSPLIGVLLACKDGYVKTHFIMRHHWERFVELMGSPDWATPDLFEGWRSGLSDIEPYLERIQAWTRQYTKADVHAMAQAARIPVLPFNTVEDFVRSPQTHARGFLVEARDGAGHRAVVPGAPYRFEGTPSELRGPAPLLGEHTTPLLRERLGYGDEQLRLLQASGVI
jgi:crotonobetainyl-CoA:carnitine CoA-transferase CaiB-like acyl-CoA transferase